MKKCLKDPNYIPTKRKNAKKFEGVNDEVKEESLDNKKEKTSNVSIVIPEVKQSQTERLEEENFDNKISKDDFENILDCIKSPHFE